MLFTDTIHKYSSQMLITVINYSLGEVWTQDNRKLWLAISPTGTLIPTELLWWPVFWAAIKQTDSERQVTYPFLLSHLSPDYWRTNYISPPATTPTHLIREGQVTLLYLLSVKLLPAGQPRTWERSTQKT